MAYGASKRARVGLRLPVSPLPAQRGWRELRKGLEWHEQLRRSESKVPGLVVDKALPAGEVRRLGLSSVLRLRGLDESAQGAPFLQAGAGFWCRSM